MASDTAKPGVRVLVTGATSGLGREMALQMARRGARVALTGRRADKLRDAAQAVRAADAEALELLGGVDDPETVRRHYAEIKDAWGGLDWAILNAGISEACYARAFKAEVVRKTFATNVLGAAHWLEAVIPDMIAAKSGRIAGIASLAGYRGLPGHGAYSASKAALIALLESVRVDLRGTGVSVTTVCPGFVKSELTAKNRYPMPFLMETRDAVRVVLSGIERKKRVVSFPWPMAFLMRRVVAHAPDALYERLAARSGPMKKADD
ncbi:MAG: SDR family NAD(P)-dependent oxidoreductase [Elusimicrobia bacterium]|nr:SDR family NAD(P)-dependent oxidoreductase [Elusimicrobiota bacterium]